MQENEALPLSTEENTETSSSKTLSTLLWSTLVLLSFAIGLASGYLIWARPLENKLAQAELRAQIAVQGDSAQQQAAQQPAEQQPAAQQQDVKRYDIPVDDDPVLGPDTAKITIVEFSDYQCPFCRRWHLEVFPQIRAKYGDQVRFVYRDFPLYSIHPEAGPAAEAANCAGEQGKYWEFNEMVFASDKDLNRALYEEFAGQIGLKMDDFQTCLTEQRYKDEVDADYQYAAQLGVRSTPTFFINGLAIVGAQPFDVFERVIDMELAGEIP